MHRLALLLLLAAAPPAAGQAAPEPARSVAVTIDDLPFVTRRLSLPEVSEATARLLEPLKRRAVPAVGFVNEDKLLHEGEIDGRVALLSQWLDAGLELGNHTFGHVSFQRTPLAEFQAATLRGDPITRWLLKERGTAPRWFRHPFTHTGPSAAAKQEFESFLAGHGYAVAPFSIECTDWTFAAAYERALARGDAKLTGEVEAAYLAHLDGLVTFYEGEAQDLFGRPIPQILLIHANALNAAVMDRLLSLFERRGYGFTSLEAALADPAWKSPDAYVGPWGPSWLHRFRVARGGDAHAGVRREPDPPAWILDLEKEMLGTAGR
jgi:peptidoglycan/xylan/chitin deacetylase (PgdA/CDA1 family)